MARTFTLDEAQMLLPVMESLLREAMTANEQREQIEREFHELGTRVFLSGGSLLNVPALKKRKLEHDHLLQRVKDALAEIESAGAQVKDLGIGLLDFPCQVDDEVILLCWKLGEPKIAHWHRTEEGYKGRKPIDERIAKAKPKPPV
ncbi:MAG: DUF2203 domain-containing protein [Terriglobales bacterium]